MPPTKHLFHARLRAETAVFFPEWSPKPYNLNRSPILANRNLIAFDSLPRASLQAKSFTGDPFQRGAFKDSLSQTFLIDRH